jgi:hypothetical protein
LAEIKTGSIFAAPINGKAFSEGVEKGAKE